MVRLGDHALVVREQGVLLDVPHDSLVVSKSGIIFEQSGEPPGLFVPKQSRRTCPDLGEVKPGVSLPHLRERSEWVALSRPGPEYVGPRFGPRSPSGEEEGYL